MILDGKKIAEEIKKELREEISALRHKNMNPNLAMILVGQDSASQVYVKNKEKACHELGIASQVFALEENTGEKELLDLISRLNKDEKTHGILVQLPLPKHIDTGKIILAINPSKDVDCFHPENVGKMFFGEPKFFPCTPAGIKELFKRYEISVKGKDCVIIGKSNIVGKPLAVMLLNQDATVMVCHEKTKNLKEKTLTADIIITAVGKAGLITADMVKSGAVVVDVGMNKDKGGKLVGDVDFEAVSKKSSFITPVPGGVGPMTVAMLMKNTVLACKLNS